MNILAIETSCDDTCVAILEAKSRKSPRFEILANVISSQVEIHRKWGGVYPTLAKREHQKNLVPVLKKALRQAKMLKIFNFQFSIFNKFSISNFQTLKKILEREEYLAKELEKFLKKYQKPKVDLIAVTVGPGLEPCLWVGVNFAKALAYFWDLPIVPVNHIESHIFANLLPQISSKSKIKNQKSKINIKNKKIEFPALCLIVSGGHTQLILMRGFGKYKILGETRDDAAGECFDKVAKILGLGYPGGPAIATEAKKIRRGRTSTDLPRPMLGQKNYDFSFSGLKTAVLYNYKTQPARIRKSKEYIGAMCKEVQQAIIDVLIKKTIKAAKDYRVKTIILGGGVSANDELRKQFRSNVKCQISNVKFLVPPKNFSTDNAVMVGVAGYYSWLQGRTKPWGKIKAEANLRIT